MMTQTAEHAAQRLRALRAGNLLWRTISVLSFTACALWLVFGLRGGGHAGETSPSETVRKAVCDAAGHGSVVTLSRFHSRNIPLDVPCYSGTQTPLAVAAQNGRAEAVAFLLQNGVHPDNHGKDGRTPLTLSLLHLYQGFTVTPAALKVDRDFARTSRLLSEAGGTTGNAVSQIR